MKNKKEKQKQTAAFPTIDQSRDKYQHLGLTKREYFASQALMGIMSACQSHSSMLDAKTNASLALLCADELIKQLEGNE